MEEGAAWHLQCVEQTYNPIWCNNPQDYHMTYWTPSAFILTTIRPVNTLEKQAVKYTIHRPAGMKINNILHEWMLYKKYYIYVTSKLMFFFYNVSSEMRLWSKQNTSKW